MPDRAEYPPRLQAILAAFDWVTDRDDRAQMLIGYAERFRPVPPEIARPPYPAENEVPFCESGVYVWTVPDEAGGLQIYFAVTNPQGVSARALAALLTEALAGLPAAEIAKVGPEIVTEIFGREITMGKGQGLAAVVEVVRARAQRAVAAGRPPM